MGAVRLVLGCLLLLGLLAVPEGPLAASARPNIVLIVADDLGYGELGAYGARDIPTPNLDALARAGVTFLDGYVSAPQCAPARAGLMTGRYQQRFGFHFNPPPPDHPAYGRFGLPAGETTLAQALKQLGYATALIGKWHLGFGPAQHPLRRGFDEFFGFLDGSHVYFGVDPVVPLYRGWAEHVERAYLTRAFARESVAFIRRQAERPFFLHVAFNAVHVPLEAVPGLLRRFAHIPGLKRRTFAAMLASLDEAVGAVVRAIRDQGLADKTLIVFLGDNGCPTAKTTCRNVPLRAGKGYLYEGGVRVPFMLAWPGRVPAGQRDRRPVVSLDLLPTLLAAATGTDYADPHLDGVNLLPYLDGRRRDQPHAALFWGGRRSGTVRRGDWKLVDLPPAPAQLYNLRHDIGETRDLAAQAPDLVAELRQARGAWAASLLPPAWPGR